MEVEEEEEVEKVVASSGETLGGSGELRRGSGELWELWGALRLWGSSSLKV